MSKKGVWVCIFSTLTSVALMHSIEAIYVLVFGNQIKLLQLYPLINQKLQEITPTAYLWGSAFATFILWGITCIIAFDSPVETFLNKMLSEAKNDGTVEAQMIEEKREILDAMNETVLTNNMLLGETKDLIYNIRAEVKEIQPLKESLERIKTELSHLKSEIDKFEEIKFLKNLQPTEIQA